MEAGAGGSGLRIARTGRGLAKGGETTASKRGPTRGRPMGAGCEGDVAAAWATGKGARCHPRRPTGQVRDGRPHITLRHRASCMRKRSWRLHPSRAAQTRGVQLPKNSPVAIAGSMTVRAQRSTCKIATTRYPAFRRRGAPSNGLISREAPGCMISQHSCLQFIGNHGRRGLVRLYTITPCALQGSTYLKGTSGSSLRSVSGLPVDASGSAAAHAPSSRRPGRHPR